MRMTVGSKCSGYGGLEMAIALWRGQEIDVRWHAEIDPDASLVLKTWWPEVSNLGDFTAPDFTAERVDLECGGVPCQPFSAAGRQLGAADPRHLWPDWRRGIAARLPETVVFENVAGLTQGKKRPVFLAIVQDLLDLGYHVRWCLLGACAVGAAHHRHRVFLLARRTHTAPTACEVTVQTCAGVRPRRLPSPAARDGSTRGEGSAEFWARKRAAGWTGGVPLGAAVVLDGLDPFTGAIARHAAVLGRPAPEPTEIGPRGGRRLAAAFSEWLMMLPEGHLTSVLGRNPALARAGNGVVPLQATTALTLLDADLQSYRH